MLAKIAYAGANCHDADVDLLCITMMSLCCNIIRKKNNSVNTRTSKRFSSTIRSFTCIINHKASCYRKNDQL